MVFVYSSLDNKSRHSMSSGNKPGNESETDSMAEYGEGETGMYNWLTVYTNILKSINACILRTLLLGHVMLCFMFVIIFFFFIIDYVFIKLYLFWHMRSLWVWNGSRVRRCNTPWSSLESNIYFDSLFNIKPIKTINVKNRLSTLRSFFFF